MAPVIYLWPNFNDRLEHMLTGISLSAIIRKTDMTDYSLPHFSNDTGSKEIFISVKKFMCAGATAPFDHPHVFLNMGGKNEKLCPYCSTLYCFDASLRKNQTKPTQNYKGY